MATKEAAHAVSQAIDAGSCERMVVAAAGHCAPPATAEHASTGDALAGLAVSLGYATLGLAILALVAGIAWVLYVRHRTKIEAKAEAEKVVPSEVKTYLESHLEGMVADALAPFVSQLSRQTPDDQARSLGEEPP